jgi:hypothetical protein
LLAVREIDFRPPRQPMPGFVLMMKLRTKAERCLSSRNKSNIEKQKLKHGFRPPVLRKTQCYLHVPFFEQKLLQFYFLSF